MSLRLPAGVRLLAFERIDSTNTHAKRLAEAGERGPLVVWALAQEGGRGRRGRSWSSPKGNLYASLLIETGRPMAESAQLSFAAALAAAEAIEALLPSGPQVRLKWPNDVLIDGAKVAGLLLEAGVGNEGAPWLVIGCGINIQSHPQDTPYPAAHLAEFDGRVTVEAALEGFFGRLMAEWQAWRARGFEPIRRRWLAKAHGIGEAVRVSLEGEVLSGIFDDLDSSGALLLTGTGGQRAIPAGEILFSPG